jgi:hypothetical protein
MNREQWNKEFIDFCERRNWWDEDTRVEIAEESDKYFDNWPNNPEEAARDVWFSCSQG